MFSIACWVNCFASALFCELCRSRGLRRTFKVFKMWSCWNHHSIFFIFFWNSKCQNWLNVNNSTAYHNAPRHYKCCELSLTSFTVQSSLVSEGRLRPTFHLYVLWHYKGFNIETFFFLLLIPHRKRSWCFSSPFVHRNIALTLLFCTSKMHISFC